MSIQMVSSLPVGVQSGFRGLWTKPERANSRRYKNRDPIRNVRRLALPDGNSLSGGIGSGAGHVQQRRLPDSAAALSELSSRGADRADALGHLRSGASLGESDSRCREAEEDAALVRGRVLFRIGAR